MNRTLIAIWYTLVFVSIFSISCTIQGDSNKKNSYVIIQNMRDFYEVTFFLNSEPIKYSNGLTIFSWSGFPLKNRENKVAISLKLNEQFNTAYHSSAKFKIAIMHDQEIYENKEIRIPFNKNKQILHTFDFDMPGMTTDTINYESISNLKNLDEEVKTITIALLSMLYNKDFERLAQLINMRSGEEFKKDYPRWVFSENEPGLSVSYVKYVEDLEVISGTKIVLVKAKQSNGNLSENRTLYRVDRKEPESEFLIQSLLFSRFSNHWMVAGLSRKFAAVNLNAIKTK